MVGDLPDFVSPVDGRVVHGRAGLREHDRELGVTNMADYTETWKKAEDKRRAFFEGRDPHLRKARKEAISRAIDILSSKRK